jgi:hypothetical protein
MGDGRDSANQVEYRCGCIVTTGGSRGGSRPPDAFSLQILGVHVLLGVSDNGVLGTWDLAVIRSIPVPAGLRPTKSA